MFVEIPPAEKVHIPGGDSGLDVILRAARSHLTGQKDPLLKARAARLTNWEGAILASHKNRLSTFVLSGLLTNGAEIPPGPRMSLEHYRTDTFRLNTRNLMAIRQIVPMIEAAGIEVCVIKGPIQQRWTHGDFFAKPAGDVDLLVAPDDFLKVRRIIERAGYYLPKECASPWWRVFLGEQHFLTDNKALSTIDLHHRVQQPGCPSPRNRQKFIDDRQGVEVGAVEIPALSQTDAILLMCMSLVKALIHREPGGGYVADIVAALGQAPEEKLAKVDQAARDQGLVGSSRVDLQACKLEYSIVSPK